MWLHFSNLFWRILHGMPAIVSSNWMAWCLGLVGFFLYHLFIFFFRGKEEMKRQWKENIGIGILAGIAGYAILFAISAVVTTYDDHHDSTGRWREVVNEKDKLKVALANQPPQPCYMQGMNMPPPRTLSGVASSGETWVVCTVEHKAPYMVTIEYDEAPISAAPLLFAKGRQSSYAEILQGKTLFFKVDSPSIIPWQGFLIVVYGRNHMAPQAVKITVNPINPDK